MGSGAGREAVAEHGGIGILKDEQEKRKLTRAEAGRLGGLATKGIKTPARTAAALAASKLGGRPRKYATASDRQRAYLERKRSGQTD